MAVHSSTAGLFVFADPLFCMIERVRQLGLFYIFKKVNKLISLTGYRTYSEHI